MRRLLLSALIAFPVLAPACYWDRDTLAEEASRGKDFIATITGRFPRNPPLYFEMRRDRLLAKKGKSPEEYDDLAVAFERLGDSLDAIRWIDRKPHGSAIQEYRTHANRGTFLIRAFLNGKLSRESGVRGLHEIEAAIKINPDAHFGRERVQVQFVQEILDPTGSLPYDDSPLKGAEGYAGIVRLGAGWEMPDIFRALAVDLASDWNQHLGAVSTLALMRADELEKAGQKAFLDKGTYFLFVEGSQIEYLKDNTEEEFLHLRREADAWQARRTAFMEERLKAGRHPDTDPTFWNGWVDGPPPEIRHYLILDRFGMPIAWWVFLLFGVCFSIPLAGVFFILRGIWRWAKLRKS